MDQLLNNRRILSRRNFGFLTTSLGLSLVTGGCADGRQNKVKTTSETIRGNLVFDNEYAPFKGLETNAGGRLGALVINTQTLEYVGYRKDERFAMCSTFKFALAGLILKGIDEGKFNANQEIPIVNNGHSIYSDLVRANITSGKMRIIDLAQEIQITSDNIAANALLSFIGGPQAFTSQMRAIGDGVTRLDDEEPAMNFVSLTEQRNTTSPFAYAQTMKKLVLDGVLSEQSSEMLIAWLRNTRTGRKRIRASLPDEWNAGDKTGTVNWAPLPNKVNDIAICWPPNKAPHIIAGFYEAPGYFEETRDQDQKVLADVGKIALDWIMRS
jgi:beta-lactamase class A